MPVKPKEPILHGRDKLDVIYPTKVQMDLSQASFGLVLIYPSFAEQTPDGIRLGDMDLREKKNRKVEFPNFPTRLRFANLGKDDRVTAAFAKIEEGLDGLMKVFAEDLQDSQNLRDQPFDVHGVEYQFDFDYQPWDPKSHKSYVRVFRDEEPEDGLEAEPEIPSRIDELRHRRRGAPSEIGMGERKRIP